MVIVLIKRENSKPFNELTASRYHTESKIICKYDIGGLFIY